MNNKIAFPELVQLIAEATGTTERMSELFLKELFATASEALIAGQKVTIKNLGTFETAHDTSGHPRLSFTPDKALAAAVNQPFAAFESIVLSDNVTDEMLHRIDEGDDEKPEALEEPKAETPVVAEEQDAEEPVAMVPPIAAVAAMTPPPFTPKSTHPEIEPMPEPESLSEPEPKPEPEIEPEPIPEPEPEPEPDSEEAPERAVRHYIDAEKEQKKRELVHKAFLRGMLTGMLATIALGAIIWGAWSSGRNSALKVVQADTIAEELTNNDTTVADINKLADEPATEPKVQATASTSAVTDTCTASMYLSKMSTKHYGKPDFWIYIYEENQDKIADPNNVPPGTVVVIPPASKYGIDAKDKASVDRARKRTYELLSN